MKRPSQLHHLRVACLCGALIAGIQPLPAQTQIELLTRPAYRLDASPRRDIPTNIPPADLVKLANSFAVLDGDFTQSQITAMRLANPALKLVKYMNSTYTDATIPQVREAEIDKLIISMTGAARLGTSLSASAADNVFTVTSLGFPIPIKASTVPGAATLSVSNVNGGSTTQYVFWIRIGGELMKVTAFNSVTGQITVLRAIDGSPLESHIGGAAGDIVYSPQYIGSGTAQGGGSSGNFPGGSATELRYCLDPWNDDGNEIKADDVLLRVGQNYDGAWFDTLNQGTFNLCDTLGRTCRPWDFALGQEMAETKFRDGQDHKMDYIQSRVLAQVGKYPVIVGNNLRHQQLLDMATNQMMAQLLKPSALKPRPIDGYCMEALYSTTQNSLATFRNALQAVRQGLLQDLAIIPFSMPDNEEAGEADTPERDRQERYSYATWLLAMRRELPVPAALFGTYAFYSTGGQRVVRMHPQYYWPIGQPLDTWTDPAAHSAYQVPGHSTVYRREFSNAVVFVSTTIASTVPLGGAYIDPDTGAQVSGNLSLAQWSGKILLKTPALPPIEAWRLAHFGVIGGVGLAADLADPDADGVSNTLEYALALDPNSSAPASALPIASLRSVGGHEYLAITFTRDLDATEITLSIEAGDGLIFDEFIDPFGANRIETVTTGSLQKLTVRDNVPLDQAGNRFMRLRAVLTE